MSVLQNRKNKVILSDYNYNRDVQNRLLLAKATSIEIDVINEIINNSLRIPINHLIELINISENQLNQILKKLIENNFIKIQDNIIIVDKDIRKYYEGRVPRLDHFIPGIEFLQYLLQQIPIHILPSWYAIPRATDNIFQAIVEKFLATPRIYERYLEELHFDNPVITQIYKDIFASPDFTLSAKNLMTKYNLTHEEFEEIVLLLEYNFVCCLSYKKIEDKWEEMVTPFHEWHEYLKFKRDTLPKNISDSSAIERLHPNDFGFIEDMTILLQTTLKKPLSIKKHNGVFNFVLSEIASLLNRNSNMTYLLQLLEKILQINLARIEDSKLVAGAQAKKWLEKTESEKSASFGHYLSSVGKSLSRIIDNEWVYFEDFMKGFVSSTVSKEAIALKNKGKKWKYELPQYTQEELAIFEEILCKRLFEAGIVSVGTYQGKSCISLTPYGKMILSY